MFNLPTKTQLGKLEIKDIFEFYDIPRLFTCKNKTGQYYLVLSIDENDEQIVWLYLEVSSERLNLLLNNKKDLYFAFKYPENDFLYKVKSRFSSEQIEIDYVFPELLTEAELPYKNTYLTSNANIENNQEINKFYQISTLNFPIR